MKNQTLFIDKDSIAVVIREALFSLMRVHINLAYDYNFNALGSLIIGRQEGRLNYIVE